MMLKLDTFADQIHMFQTAPHECFEAFDKGFDVLSDFAESGDPKFIDAALQLGPFGVAEIGYHLLYLDGRTVKKITSDPMDFYINPPLVYEG